MSDPAATLEPNAAPEPPPPAGAPDGRADAGQAASAAPPEPVPTVEMQTTIGSATIGRDMNVSNIESYSHSQSLQVENQVVQLFQDRAVVRPFSCDEHGDPVPAEWEETSALSVRASDAEVEALLEHLERDRVLLLSAERGAGKVRMAVYLAWRLRQRGRCQAPTVIAESRQRRVRLDLRHLVSGDRALQDRVVVFPEPFLRAHPEASRLFERADGPGWQPVAERLRARGAYLVFLTEPAGEGPPDVPSPARGVTRSLSAHPREVLEGELEQKLEELEGAGAASEPLRALREGRGWLLDRCRYTCQVLDFVERYLELEPPGLELDEAWRRTHDAGGRILQDLDGDFEGWSFAFSLALAQGGRDADGAAWVDVDRLHRHVRQWLRRDLNVRYPRGSEDADADEGADTWLEFADTRLLARAKVDVDGNALAHTVRFRGSSSPDVMWAAMLQRHRRALLTVLPRLRGLAERGDEELGTLRVLAARAIGRIGEMDPLRITLPLVERWMRSDDWGHRAAVGPLVDGVLSSPSERYRSACLDRLRALHRPSSAGERPSEHLPTIIAAYSWVGDHDLEYAMRELGALAREYLDPLIEDMQRIERLLDRVERLAEEEGSAARNAVLRSWHGRLRELASRIYAERGGVFVGVKLAAVSLCGSAGAVPVFRELRKWMVEGSWRTGVLVALIFLERGLADRLRAGETATGGATAPCNALLLELAEDEGRIRQTCRFIGDLYESLGTPFAVAPALQRYCTESLLEHLLGWVRDGLPVPEHAEAMRGLLVGLMRTHGGILRERLCTFLDDLSLRDDEPRLREFALSVRMAARPAAQPQATGVGPWAGSLG